MFEKKNDSISACDELCEDEDMADEDFLKLSQKRKIQDTDQTSLKASKLKTGSDMGKLSIEAESDFSASQEDQQGCLSLDDIKKILKPTRATDW